MIELNADLNVSISDIINNTKSTVLKEVLESRKGEKKEKDIHREGSYINLYDQEVHVSFNEISSSLSDNEIIKILKNRDLESRVFQENVDNYLFNLPKSELKKILCKFLDLGYQVDVETILTKLKEKL